MADPNINKKISEFTAAASISDTDKFIIARAGTPNTNLSVTGAIVKALASTPTPAGSNTHVQFNDGGALGADAGMTYNKTADTLTVLGGHLGQTGAGTTKNSVFGAHLKGGTLAAGANTGAQSTADAGNNGGIVLVVLSMVTADGLTHVFDIFIQAHGQTYNLQSATMLNQLTDGDLVLSHTSGAFAFTFTNNSAQTAYWQVRVLPLADLYSTKGGY